MGQTWQKGIRRDALPAEARLLAWRKSRRSVGNGNCVEVAQLPDRNFAMRDSKDKSGAVLIFTPGEWHAFVAGVKDGEFDTF
jgi:hypothetical protein